MRRCKAGARPVTSHLVNLFDLTAGMGLLHILLPPVGEPEVDMGRG